MCIRDRLNVDWVALSFVNQASDVNQAREVLSSIDNQMRVIAKIERLSALKQLYWIIKASDGVMVARGDLALESGPGELTGLQKTIINQPSNQHPPTKCHHHKFNNHPPDTGGINAISSPSATGLSCATNWPLIANET